MNIKNLCLVVFVCVQVSLLSGMMDPEQEKVIQKEAEAELQYRFVKPHLQIIDEVLRSMHLELFKQESRKKALLLGKKFLRRNADRNSEEAIKRHIKEAHDAL
jgi:hypothetical protein